MQTPLPSAQIEAEISVVVPVWGDYAGEPLAEALASLRAQDLAPRIIVVDNASDPPLEDIDGVEVVRAPSRLTVGAARNLGLEAVKTPYVLFWDADDLMLPGTLRFLRDRIASDPRLVLVAAAIREEGDPPTPHRWPRHWTYPLTRYRRAFSLAHCVWSLFPTTGSSIIRSRDAAIGFGDANSGEDWQLGVSLAFRGRISLESRPGRVYRRHPTSLWETQRSGRKLMDHSRAVRERIRRDPEIPASARLLLPAIAVLQFIAVRVVRPLTGMMRAIRAPKAFR